MFFSMIFIFIPFIFFICFFILIPFFPFFSLPSLLSSPTTSIFISSSFSIFSTLFLLSLFFVFSEPLFSLTTSLIFSESFPALKISELIPLGPEDNATLRRLLLKRWCKRRWGRGENVWYVDLVPLYLLPLQRIEVQKYSHGLLYASILS